MIYYIEKCRFVSFDKRIQSIIKKCKKHDIPFVYHVGDVEEKTLRIRFENFKHTVVSTIKVVPIELNVTFKQNGWTFVGCTKNVDGIKQAYYQNFEDAKKYINLDMTRCDHCHTKRQRKSVSVLEHDNGQRMIVGTTCVKEFTCGLDGVFCAKFLNLINDEVIKYAIEDDMSNDYYDQISGGVTHYLTEDIVSIGCSMIDKYGFCSKERAKWDNNVIASVNRFDRFFDDVYANIEKVTDEHKALAKKAIEWCANLTEEETNTGYLLNLREICKSKMCVYSQWGMLLSLIPTYKKHLEIYAEKQKQEINPSFYVGEIGDKIKLKVSFISDSTIDTRFGCMHILRFESSNGNVFIWKTNKSIKHSPGDVLDIKGTVKAHEEYRHTKQTILTRVSELLS